MKTAINTFIVALSLCLAPAALGQRVLDETEIGNIVKQLTSQPRSAWISAGEIRATHYQERGPQTTDAVVIQAAIDKAVKDCQQKISAAPVPDTVAENPQKLELEAAAFNARYDLENAYTMTTSELVKYDGQRFSWEVAVTGRTDSMALDSGLDGNYMANHYSVHKEFNNHRIFTWDGQEYTTYSVSGGHALVDATGMKPHIVNGPLTAGLIPWGAGGFSTDNLAEADITATEISLDKAAFIEMTIVHSSGSVTKVLLDPSKDYAVTNATLTAIGIVVTYTYSDYQLVSDRWVPGVVVIDRKIDSTKNRMPTHERWTDITVTSVSTPPLGSFEASPAADAIVEYASPATASSVSYVNSYDADTKALLAKRLTYEAFARKRPRNCGTAALEYTASGFGKSVSPAALASLVQADGRTSLYDLRQAARNLGLYANVVTTDLATLKTLGATKAILHLPGKNHFVVLDRVDERFVWLVDLSSKMFYYRQNVHLFPMNWSAGTALLISDQPLSSRLPALSDADAKEIAAGYWTCNTRYQEFYYTGCDVEWYVTCDGVFRYYYERWICGSVDSGTCDPHVMVRIDESPCVYDPEVWCQITGYWTSYVMRACL